MSYLMASTVGTTPRSPTALPVAGLEQLTASPFPGGDAPAIATLPLRLVNSPYDAHADSPTSQTTPDGDSGILLQSEAWSLPGFRQKDVSPLGFVVIARLTLWYPGTIYKSTGGAVELLVELLERAQHVGLSIHPHHEVDPRLCFRPRAPIVERGSTGNSTPSTQQWKPQISVDQYR